MSFTRRMWYAGTVLAALAMLAASATAAAQGQARAVHAGAVHAGGGRAAVDSSAAQKAPDKAPDNP